MASYGRNFEFRVVPQGSARGGRFCSPSAPLAGSGAGGGSVGTGLIPIGAPLVVDTAAGLDTAGRQYVKLAPAGALTTAEPLCGIAVYEYAGGAFAGTDPYLTTYSDLSVVPLNQGVEMVAGDPSAKVVLSNTAAFSFLGQRNYVGRTMVNGLGATTSVAVGDYLVPGAGDDVDGYWQSTTSEAGAWLVITGIDTTRLQVEARLLF